MYSKGRGFCSTIDNRDRILSVLRRGEGDGCKLCRCTTSSWAKATRYDYLNNSSNNSWVQWCFWHFRETDNQHDCQHDIRGWKLVYITESLPKVSSTIVDSRQQKNLKNISPKVDSCLQKTFCGETAIYKNNFHNCFKWTMAIRQFRISVACYWTIDDNWHLWAFRCERAVSIRGPLRYVPKYEPVCFKRYLFYTAVF